MGDDLKIYLSGYLDVPAERRASVYAALPVHVALTRQETGCVSFDVSKNDQTLGRLDVAEVFMDQAAFDMHQTRTKASEWFLITQGIPRHFVIKLGSDG